MPRSPFCWPTAARDCRPPIFLPPEVIAGAARGFRVEHLVAQPIFALPARFLLRKYRRCAAFGNRIDPFWRGHPPRAGPFFLKKCGFPKSRNLAQRPSCCIFSTSIWSTGAGGFRPPVLTKKWRTAGRYSADFYHTEIKNFPKNSLAERRFDRIEFEGIPLTGTIDRIDSLEKGAKIHLVDYKVSRPTTENLRRLAPPSDENPNGGEYWRQLVFYKILVENARNIPGFAAKIQDGAVESGAVIWLETGQKSGFSHKNIHFSMGNTGLVKTLVRDVWTKNPAPRIFGRLRKT